MHVNCKRIYLYCLWVVEEILKDAAKSFSLATVKVNLLLRLKIKSFNTNMEKPRKLSSKLLYGTQGNSVDRVYEV